MNNTFSFSALKAKVSINQVLAAYGFEKDLRHVGNQLRGPCPIHGGDNPTAFCVHPEKGIWHCFTECGGGDVVDLVRKINECSFAEAARRLHRIACHDMQTRLNSPAKQLGVHPKSQTFVPFTRSIPLTFSNEFLWQQKGITAFTAQSFEAGIATQSKFLHGMVAVRLHDPCGKPLGYCGRRLHSDGNRGGKWHFPKNFPKNKMLYNAHRARRFQEQTIFVVEGPWGAMRLAQAGVPNTVALLGAALFPAQADWLAKASTVVLLLDGDEVGRKAALKIHSLLAPRTTVVRHSLPHGSDPDDLTDEQLALLARHYCHGD